MLDASLTLDGGQAAGPHLVCYSFMTMQREVVAKEIIELKRRYGDRVILIAGGSHCSGAPEDALALGFHHVVKGPGEAAIREVVRLWLEGQLLPVAKVWETQAQVLLKDYPPFSYCLEVFSPVEITRGCPWQCGYCQTPKLWGNQVQHRPLQQLAEAMRYAVRKQRFRMQFLSPNAFCYGSTTLNQPEPEAIEELMKTTISSGMQRITFGMFPSEARPEYVTDEILAVVKRYCSNKSIQIGIQSASDRVLKQLHRGHTVAQGLAAVKLIHAFGFRPLVDLMFGFPGETEEEREATADLAEVLVRDYQAWVHLHWFLRLPGTALADAEVAPPTPKLLNNLERLESMGKVTGWWREQAENT